jgi:hypothetical protein
MGGPLLITHKKIRCSDKEIELMGSNSAFFMAGLDSNNVCARAF